MSKRADQDGTRGRIYQFDYLKAVCIIMIVITHAAVPRSFRSTPFFVFLVNMAVPVFLIVYSYMQTMQYEKRGSASSGRWIFGRTFRKIYNIYLPFLVVFAVEIYVKDFSAPKILSGLLRGGYGPGSYFVPLLLQLLILFPVLYALLKRYPVPAVILIGISHVIYELAANRWMSDSVYRILCFRYLPFLAAGILFYLYRDITGKAVVVLMFFSLAYLIALFYLDYQPRLYSRWLDDGAGILVFWALALTIAFVKYMPRLPGVLHWLVMAVGQSTYYIFLTQMLYYYFEIDGQLGGALYGIPVNLLITVTAGVLFCRVERWLYRLLFRQKN